MAVKLRMQRRGSKKRPFYFIVAAHSAAPRDGKYIEKIGTYNPLTVPATIELDNDKALSWLQKGAQPTNTVRGILSFKGVLYKKHLLRGVSLGLFDEAAAEEKFAKWMEDHEQVVLKRQESHRIAKQEKRHAVVMESVKKVEEKNAAKRAEEAEALAAAEGEANAAAEVENASNEATPVAEDTPTQETEANAPEQPEGEDSTPAAE